MFGKFKSLRMSEHNIHVQWSRDASKPFQYEAYDRSHVITFPGGQTVKSSAAPEFLGRAELANPEEMLAAALSTCHMLTFLAICAKSRLEVLAYEDEAGRLMVNRLTLRPLVKFATANPVDADKLRDLHEKAHANCFVAMALKSSVAVESRA